MPTLVLASASPRRRELLARIGLACEVRPVTIDERPLPSEQPEAHVQRLALEKARAGARRLGRAPGAVVLGADTIVVCDGVLLGKPVDRDDGLSMLARLSGRRHEVLTAIATVATGPGGREATALSRSEVSLRAIGPDEAAAYWATGEPADKAGGYALQGIGAIFVEAVRGSCSGVVGLPLHETACLLSEYGIHPLPVGAEDDRVPDGDAMPTRDERS